MILFFPTVLWLKNSNTTLSRRQKLGLCPCGRFFAGHFSSLMRCELHQQESGRALQLVLWQPTPVLLPRESVDRGAWCRLLSMGSQRVGHDWATSLSFFLFFSQDPAQCLHVVETRQRCVEITSEWMNALKKREGQASDTLRDKQKRRGACVQHGRRYSCLCFSEIRQPRAETKEHLFRSGPSTGSRGQW